MLVLSTAPPVASFDLIVLGYITLQFLISTAIVRR